MILERLPFCGAVFGPTCLSALAALVLGAGVALTAAAEEFGEFDPHSTVAVDHAMWAEFLESVPIPYEKAERYMATSEWDCRTVRSRIRRCKPLSTLTSSMQGTNLLPFQYMNPEMGLFLRTYLRRMSDIEPASLNREEQLAFWFNVHNAAVVLNLFHAYPLDKVPTGAEAGEDGEEFWTKPVLTVAGRALSVRDIEQDILFEYWSDPLILYGLFDGSVESPALLDSPFSGRTVYATLRTAATDYINSPRALRVRGDTVTLAAVYERGAKLFKSDAGLIDHLRSFAQSDLRRELADVVRVETDVRYPKLAEFAIKGRLSGTNSKDLNELSPGIKFEGFYFGPGARGTPSR